MSCGLFACGYGFECAAGKRTDPDYCHAKRIVQNVNALLARKKPSGATAKVEP